MRSRPRLGCIRGSTAEDAASLLGMSRLVATVDALGGIARRDQLLGRGFSGPQLSAAVHAGDLTRVRRAHYASRSARPEAREAVRLGGRLAGLSAARSYGLWSGYDLDLHVAVPRTASRLRGSRDENGWAVDESGSRVRLHWVDLDRAHPECWRVSMVDCLRQVLDWADRETAIACVESAALELRLPVEELRIRIGAAAARSTVRWGRVENGSESGAESIVRLRLEDAGFALDRQRRFPGVGRVDFWIRDSRVIVEVDGFAFHSHRLAFENDRSRDAELAARGMVVVRLTLRAVMNDWPRCLNQLRRAVAHFPPYPTQESL